MTIAIHEGGSTLTEQMQFAETLSASNLLPKQYSRQPANVLLAMQLGNALGIPAIQAITGIHVVEGKPTASADLIASLVRKAGHRLRIVESKTISGPSVTATLIRADDPDFAFEVTWDMDKARAAGLAGKAVWKQYPGQMLRSRAITEVARQGASDALYGVIYTSEELDVESDFTPQTTVTQQPEPSRSSKPKPPSAADIMAAAEQDRDWLHEIESATTTEELRAMWPDAPEDMRPYITARVADLQAAPVDAELVDEA